MTNLKQQAGQTLVLTVLFMTVLLGMAAFVIDIGSWFREQRDTQRIADAAALAGAQALPENAAEARVLANQYTTTNGGSSPQISFRNTVAGTGTDTIQVEIRREAPGFFAKLFGIDSVDVGARASARAGYPGAVRWVAPIVVHYQHEKLICTPLPCFNQATEIPLYNLHSPGSGTAAGSFGLISLNNEDVNANTLAEWLLKGYDGWTYVDRGYRAAPSANFNNGQFQSALEKRKGTELLFPIYRTIEGEGSTAQYEVIGWVGFIVEKVTGGGANSKLHGYFTRVVWEGMPGTSAPPVDYGVRAIELIE
jgi:hypothetical protein